LFCGDFLYASQNNSNDDEHSAPSLSISERQALLEKYNTSDPDPQGVVYKGFSRNSNVIKERINDGKPKRSKSFQQTREREFARGKSLSSLAVPHVCRKELVRGGFGGGFPGMEEAREKLLL
jgi:hypothetical protein